MTMISIAFAVALLQTGTGASAQGAGTGSAPTPPPDAAVSGETETPEPLTPRAPPQMICEMREVTGSRFRHRVCVTPQYAEASRMEAQSYLRNARPGGSTEAAASASGPQIGPGPQ